MPIDRRSHPRIPRPALAVRVREHDKYRWMPTECIDFNRHGMAISSSRPLTEGTRLIVAMEGVQSRLDEVLAVVHNCRQQHGTWRCGLQFRPQVEDGSTEVAATLKSIEEELLAEAPPRNNGTQ